jgi:adenosylcobinamide amidohydrolase/ABC-type Fe3+-hydroxamate transport system substrate-binding protein
MKLGRFIFKLCFFLAALILTQPMSSLGTVFPMSVTDAYQNKLRILEKPQRVVSLVPYITEMLLAFGQDQALVGLTRQDLNLHRAIRKKNLGGYFCPDIEAIADCHPDLIIAAPSHKKVIRRFDNGRCKVMIMEVRKLKDAFSQMEMLGRLFDCENEAAAVIQRNLDKLALVKAKLAAIPSHNRKRVVRVMAGDGFACPGDDSFQNEMIAAAGGIPPQWGRNGFAVSVNLKEWQQFNPQVVYGCHLNEKAVQALLNREGWKDVDAVRTGFVTMFPCDLTCQVSTRVGDFVEWLAAVLYLDSFADPEKAVLENGVIDRRPLSLDLAYVDHAQVVRHRVADAEYKSLVVRFKRPLDVLSTLEGNKSGVWGVGNTYVSMHASLGHMAFGVEQAQTAIAINLGYAAGEFAGLMTGANMKNLSVQKATYHDLEVTAMVTAGVRGNALRMSKDSGGYSKPGTINIIVLTNRRLSSSAMAWAVVTVTEAKSAALLDLDIRSSYTPWDFRATGTGTDTVIVVQGEGPVERYAGGHTKIGELIAKAVHAGVTEAIFKQNGLTADRDLFQRLADRRMSLERIAKLYSVTADKKVVASKLEDLLMIPYYASFIESALAISDDYGKGLIKELAFFDAICCSVAARLSGRPDFSPTKILFTNALPVVMDRAFGALVAGITEKDDERKDHR